MTKKIGFRHYQEDDDAKKQDKQERQTAIADFLRQNYAPIGPTSQKVYKTTYELQYDLQNIIDVPANELAKQLTEARFAIEYVCGQPFWVLYERIKE